MCTNVSAYHFLFELLEQPHAHDQQLLMWWQSRISHLSSHLHQLEITPKCGSVDQVVSLMMQAVQRWTSINSYTTYVLTCICIAVSAYYVNSENLNELLSTYLSLFLYQLIPIGCSMMLFIRVKVINFFQDAPRKL